MTLPEFWFVLIAVLFIGYFLLEGFDFGVGILMPFLGQDDVDRRVVINTIGPFWDANEAWLIMRAARCSRHFRIGTPRSSAGSISRCF